MAEVTQPRIGEDDKRTGDQPGNASGQHRAVHQQRQAKPHQRNRQQQTLSGGKNQRAQGPGGGKENRAGASADGPQEYRPEDDQGRKETHRIKHSEAQGLGEHQNLKYIEKTVRSVAGGKEPLRSQQKVNGDLCLCLNFQIGYSPQGLTQQG